MTKTTDEGSPAVHFSTRRINRRVLLAGLSAATASLMAPASAAGALSLIDYRLSGPPIKKKLPATAPLAGTAYHFRQGASDTASDVTPAINAWLAGLPDGTPSNPTIARFGANKTYRIDSSVNVIQRSWLEIDGNGSTFVRPAAPPGTNIRHFTFDRCFQLTVRNIRVTGSVEWPTTWSSVQSRPGGDGQWDHAFAFLGCHHVLHEDCDYENVWGDGVYLGAGLSAWSEATRNYTARRVHGRRAARGGLQVVHGSDVVFEDCDVDIQTPNYGPTNDYAGLFGVNVEPNDGNTCRDITFRRCRVGRTRLPGLQVVGDSSQVRPATIDGVTFDRCHTFPGSGAVLFVDCRPGRANSPAELFHSHRYSNISVVGCSFNTQAPDYMWGPQPGSPGLYPFMRFMLIDGVSVLENAQPGQSDRSLVFSGDCSEVSVRDNITDGYTAELTWGSARVR